MSELLRRPESANIGADLRVRLEGQVELLEDAVPLLESAVAALNREELTADDVDTLREAHNQLPRLEAALASVRRFEEASALVALLELRLSWVRDAVSLALKAEPASVRVGLGAVLDKVKRREAPRADETVLATNASPSVLGPGVAAVVSPIALGLATASPLAILAAPVAWLIGRRLQRSSAAWVLLPDRLYFGASAQHEARNVELSSIRSTQPVEGAVEVELPDERVRLRTDEPPRLATLLALLGGTWLRGLDSRPTRCAVLEGVDETSRARGVALVTSEGVLFLAKSQVERAHQALTPRRLGALLDLEALLRLLAHVPVGRWPALAEHLEDEAEAQWVPRREMVVAKTANDHLGVTVGNVRLLFAAPGKGTEEQLRAEALLRQAT